VIDDHAVAMQQADTCDDGVFAARKQAQHAAGVCGIRRFFENPLIDDDDRIGPRTISSALSQAASALACARRLA